MVARVEGVKKRKFHNKKMVFMIVFLPLVSSVEQMEEMLIIFFTNANCIIILYNMNCFIIGTYFVESTLLLRSAVSAKIGNETIAITSWHEMRQ